MEPFTLSPRDAASYASLSLTTIKKLLRDGKLEAVKAGRRTLIRRADLEAYLRDLPPARGTLLSVTRGDAGRFA